MNIVRDISRAFFFSTLAILFGTVPAKFIITGSVWSYLISLDLNRSFKLFLLMFTEEFAYLPAVLIFYLLFHLLSQDESPVWNIFLYLLFFYTLKIAIALSLGIIQGKSWFLASLSASFIFFILLYLFHFLLDKKQKRQEIKHQDENS